MPGWTYGYQALVRTEVGAIRLGEVRSFTTAAAAEPSWMRVFLPGTLPGLVALGSGFAVRGGSWGSPTWTTAFDGDGALRWQRLGPTGDEVGSGARPAQGGCLAVFRGRTSNSPTPSDWHSEVWLMDGSGTVVWQWSVPRWLSVAAPTADGGALLVGDLGEGPVWMRLRSTGSLAWAATHDAGLEPMAVLELEGGALAFVGRSVRLPGSRDGIPVEVRTAEGTVAWRRTFSRTEGERAEAAEPTPDGGLLIAGDTWEGPLWEPLALRLDPNGSVVWSVKVAGEHGPATGLSPSGDGGWLLAGAGNEGNLDTRYAWVAKLDADGRLLWATHFPGKFQSPVRVLGLAGGRFVLAAQVDVGYNTFGVGVIFADAARRAGGAGVDVTRSAPPVTLTVDTPLWSDRAVAFPPFTSGGQPLQPTNVAAVRLAP